VISVFVGLVYCLMPVFCAVLISGSLILLHALMRDPKQIESCAVFRGGADSDEEEDGGSREDEGESSGEEVMVHRSDACV